MYGMNGSVCLMTTNIGGLNSPVIAPILPERVSELLVDSQLNNLIKLMERHCAKRSAVKSYCLSFTIYYPTSTMAAVVTCRFCRNSHENNAASILVAEAAFNRSKMGYSTFANDIDRWILLLNKRISFGILSWRIHIILGVFNTQEIKNGKVIDTNVFRLYLIYVSGDYQRNYEFMFILGQR
jgi:hypothetical protein